MAVTTFTRTITADTDDATEAPAGAPLTGAPIAAMAVNNAWCGLRFTDMAIPVGATITSAVVTMVISDGSKNDAQGRWLGNDVDDAATFTTADGNVDSRTVTTAEVAWTTNDLGSLGASVASPNLATILQEIVDRPGWEPNNAVAFLYHHQSGAEFLQFALLENTTYAPPSLSVTFTTDDYGSPDPIVEAAFGADLNASYLTWEWTDLSDRLLPQTLTVKRGRADEGQRTASSTFSAEFDNEDGALTPDHPMSPYWPNVDRGTPLRLRYDLPPVTPYMDLFGDDANYASTPDAAGHDFTGDMCAWADVDIRTNGQLISKWADLSDERSYYLYTSPAGSVGFVWSEDGINLRVAVTDTGVVDYDRGGRRAYGVEFDANDGAGGFVARFYSAPTAAGPWTQIGDDVTEDFDGDSSSTSIYAGTAPVTVALPIGSTPEGKFYSAGTRTGTSLTGGTVICNPNFAAQTPGTTSFADTASTPKTWTLVGDAVITDEDTRATRFFGQMDGVNPTWPEGDNGESTVNISASGMLRRLGQGSKPLASTLYRGLIRSQKDRLNVADVAGVVAWWPMEEDRGAGSIASPLKGCPPMAIGGNMEPAGGEDLPAAKATMAARDVHYYSANVPPYAKPTTTNTRVDMFQFTTQPTGGYYLFAVNTDGTAIRWAISYSGSLVTIQAWDAFNNVLVNDTSALSAAFFETWVLWSFNIDDDGAGTVSYNLTLVDIPEGTGAGYTGSFSGTAGNVTAVHNWGTPTPNDGISMSHLIVSTGTGVGWLAGYDTAWRGESAAHRFRRLCIEEGISFRCIGDNTLPFSFRGDTARSQAMGYQQPKPLLDLFQECVDADFGLMMEERDRFGLIFRTGQSLQNQEPRLTLDATTRDEGGLVVSDVRNPFAPTKDDQRIRNDVTVKREGGSSFRATTDPPPPPDDLYDEEVTVNVESDVHLPAITAWRLHLGTWPGMRYPNVSTDAADSPHLADGVLDILEGDRIVVTGLPSSHPSTDVDILAEGLEETVSPHAWGLVANASPGGPWITGVRDDEEGLARRDSASTTMEDDMTTADTVCMFNVNDGLPWTAEASDYPLDIVVSGERMTATDITDLGGGVYYFDVVRAVNGVLKEHHVGDAVHIWQPVYRAIR